MLLVMWEVKRGLSFSIETVSFVLRLGLPSRVIRGDDLGKLHVLVAETEPALLLGDVDGSLRAIVSAGVADFAMVREDGLPAVDCDVVRWADLRADSAMNAVI